VPGVARVFSRSNVREIALMQRLIEAGMSPSAAAEKLARLFARLKQRSPEGGFVTFFPSGDFVLGPEPPSARLISATAAIVVNLSLIADAVDEAFKEAGNEEQPRPGSDRRMGGNRRRRS
jgi:hypothetical protein